MFGGNWFVPVAFDTPYGRTVDLVSAAVERFGARKSERDAARSAVFSGTASRIYGLAPTA